MSQTPHSGPQPTTEKSAQLRVSLNAHRGVVDLKRAYQARTTNQITVSEIIEGMLRSHSLANWVERLIKGQAKKFTAMSEGEEP